MEMSTTAANMIRPIDRIHFRAVESCRKNVQLNNL